LLAERLWKDYDSQYSASHLTWVDFEGEARGHLDALAEAGLLVAPAKTGTLGLKAIAEHLARAADDAGRIEHHQALHSLADEVLAVHREQEADSG
jgi:glycogen debranching enzyme